MSVLAVGTRPTDGDTDDRDLVAGVRAGDDRAFALLYQRYQPRIGAYVRRMVRDDGRAEDITQEVFIAALRRMREDGTREILFKPWIFEIAKNKCIDAFRRTRNAREVSFDARDEVCASEHDRLAEPGATPDSAIEGKLAIDNLRGAFGGLSEVHHDILVLREFDGLSYREIGERLGMSRAAVESTLFRARKRLSEEYDELVSGERCLRVRYLVDEHGGRATGLRDRRQMSRHLAHCQPCRRYAGRAGLDLGAVARPTGAGARIAAFLPLPAFLRRRWGDEGSAASPLVGHHGSMGQWSANVAAVLDPGVVSGWTKAVAAAATVAVTGMGAGAAFTDRAAFDGFRDAGLLRIFDAQRDAPTTQAPAPGHNAPARDEAGVPGAARGGARGDVATHEARAPGAAAAALEARAPGAATAAPAALAAPAAARQAGGERGPGRSFESKSTPPPAGPATAGDDMPDARQPVDGLGRALGSSGAGGRDPAAGANSDVSASVEAAPALLDGSVAPIGEAADVATGQPATATAAGAGKDAPAATSLIDTVSGKMPADRPATTTTTTLQSFGG